MPLENGFVFLLIDFAKYLHNYKSDLLWILQLEKKHVEIYIVSKNTTKKFSRWYGPNF